ncbi:hypothetical protein FOA52_005494 [Chlamydomonas sp. UWO 241]|nr:hypothetical protein FOA52_005494 [Chlamydomonas sp. UWO 241]
MMDHSRSVEALTGFRDHYGEYEPRFGSPAPGVARPPWANSPAPDASQGVPQRVPWDEPQERYHGPQGPPKGSVPKSLPRVSTLYNLEMEGIEEADPEPYVHAGWGKGLMQGNVRGGIPLPAGSPVASVPFSPSSFAGSSPEPEVPEDDNDDEVVPNVLFTVSDRVWREAERWREECAKPGATARARYLEKVQYTQRVRDAQMGHVERYRDGPWVDEIRARRTLFPPPVRLPPVHYHEVDAVLDVLLANRWSETNQEPNTPYLLVLWRGKHGRRGRGQVTWEEMKEWGHSLGMDWEHKLAMYMMEVSRIYTHQPYPSRSLMGYDHRWMPSELMDASHNYGHDLSHENIHLQPQE